MAAPRTEPTSAFLIAPCGLDCRLCRAYQRRRNPCPGCRAEDAAKPKTRVICRIKTCPKVAFEGIQFCFECGDFPCAHVLHLEKRYRAKYRTSPVENLVAIRERGMDEFIEGENREWACPGCGAMLCMHEEGCPRCGHLRG